MKITNMQAVKTETGKRVSAVLQWEDSSRPEQEIYVEVDEPFATHLRCNPHTFLTAAVIPAMRFGERRVAIEAKIDPALLDGLRVIMRLLRGWYGRYGTDYPLPQIESGIMAAPEPVTVPPNAAFLMSGGIDSLATLRSNRLAFPLSHPRAFHTAVIIKGLQPEVDDIFDKLVASLQPLAAEAGVTLMPVRSNIRYIYDSWPFWADEFEGAVFSAIIHAFAPYISALTIGTTYDEPYLHPHGSHPLVDHHYSTSDMTIIHDDITLSRLEKTVMLADWELALHNMRVCNFPDNGDVLNCGRCEKCVRTMLALTTLSKLAESRAFAADDISADLVETGVQLNKTSYPFYPELIRPLQQCGRHDLADAVQKKLRNYGLEKQRRRLKRVSQRPLTLFRKKVLHQYAE